MDDIALPEPIIKFSVDLAVRVTVLSVNKKGCKLKFATNADVWEQTLAVGDIAEVSLSFHSKHDLSWLEGVSLKEYPGNG